MNARNSLVLVLAFTISAASAMADSAVLGSKDSDGKGGAKASEPTIAMTWDQFKQQCADPDSSPIQRAPQNIQVQCTDIRQEFVPQQAGSVPLATARHVITALSSNKFYVRSEDRGLQTAAAAGSCLRYKEVEESFSVEKALSCAEILNIKGDINDYCASATEMVKGANPKLINTRDTGRAIDTCSGIAVTDKGGKNSLE